MATQAKTAEQIVEYLLDNAIEQNNCLISHLAPNAKGYIPVQVGGRSGKKWRAHRLVCHIVNGCVADEELVRHSCDNRACINPVHLVPGSAVDNTDDMIKRGRAKFVQPRTDHLHRDNILRLHAQGLSRIEIANRLCVSPSTVWNYISPKGAYHAQD